MEIFSRKPLTYLLTFLIVLIIFSICASFYFFLLTKFKIQEYKYQIEQNNHSNRFQQDNKLLEKDQNVKIEKISSARFYYKDKHTSNMHMFILDILKIDNCKYIIIHKTSNIIEMIHANDCDFCCKNSTKKLN